MRIDDTNGVLARSTDGVGVFSVNKMLGSLSNMGHGFCVVESRISPEVWVSNSAWRDGGAMALGPRKLRLGAFEWQSGLSGRAACVAARCLWQSCVV